MYAFPDFHGVGEGQSDVLGVQDNGAVLTATQHGWEILGVAWYWWATMLVGAAGLSLGAKLLLAKSSLGIVK